MHQAMTRTSQRWGRSCVSGVSCSRRWLQMETVSLGQSASPGLAPKTCTTTLEKSRCSILRRTNMTTASCLTRQWPWKTILRGCPGWVRGAANSKCRSSPKNAKSDSRSTFLTEISWRWTTRKTFRTSHLKRSI